MLRSVSDLFCRLVDSDGMDREDATPHQRLLTPTERSPLVATDQGASRMHPAFVPAMFGHHRVAPSPGAPYSVNETANPQLAGLPSHVMSQVNNVNDKRVKHWKFSVVVALFQCLLLGIFMKFVKYSADIDASRGLHGQVLGANRSHVNFYTLYPVFQSDTLLIFFGISFLYFFMKKYGFTSAGYNFFICALGIEISLLLQGIIDILLCDDDSMSGYIEVDVRSCLKAEFSAVTVPIALGCVLGKIGPLQLLVFSFIEIVLYNLNEMVGTKYLHVSDAGGSIFLHAFACYYGLAACAVLYNPDQETSKNLSVSHTTDLFAVGGTLMLWCIWPSFNSGLLFGEVLDDQQHRAILNTFLSLVGSCLATFGTSSFLSLKGKFNITHIQNATLAGGVAIGSCCNLMVHPGGALIIGTIAGCVCTCGMHVGSPFLTRVLKVHDVSSVHNLHGLPAILACLSSAFMVIWATRDVYQDTLYLIYPAMAPDSSKQLTETAITLGVKEGYGWTRSFQAVMQLVALIMTVVVAIAGGTIAGHLMKLKCLDEPPAGMLYTDEAFWEPKAGKVFVFDGSVATANSPNSVRRGTFVIPSTADPFSMMWNQQNRFHHGDYGTPNLSDIEENLLDTDSPTCRA